jgi:hypothetical protein
VSRYLLLLTGPGHFDQWDAASEAEQEQDFAAFREFLGAVRERGAVLAGEALVRPEEARTIGPGATPAERPVTDGPYAEVVEEIGGFYLVDLPDLQAAVEVATLLPRSYAVEVRACLDVDATGSG